MSNLLLNEVLFRVASCSLTSILVIPSFSLLSSINFSLCIYLSHEIKLELKYLLAICKLLPPGAAQVSNILYFLSNGKPIDDATRALASSCTI